MFLEYYITFSCIIVSVVCSSKSFSIQRVFNGSWTCYPFLNFFFFKSSCHNNCVLLSLSASTFKINNSTLYFLRCLRSCWCATSTGKVLCIAHNVSSLALRNADRIGSHTRYLSPDVRYSLWHQIFTTPRRQTQERSSTNPNLLPPSLTPQPTEQCCLRIGLFSHLKTHKDPQEWQSYSTANEDGERVYVCANMGQPGLKITLHHTMVKWVRTCLQGLFSVSNTVLSLLLSGYYLSKCYSESLWAATCALCSRLLLWHIRSIHLFISASVINLHFPYWKNLKTKAGNVFCFCFSFEFTNWIEE